jgi:hypothetical protein
LSEADVPGWIRETSGDELKVARTNVEAARCAGAVDPNRILVNRLSPIYHQPQAGAEEHVGSMYSVVLVWPTAALAAKNANAFLRPRGVACVARGKPHELTYKAVGGGVVRRVRKSISRLPDPFPRAPASFEFRTIWTEHIPAKPHYKSRLGTFSFPAETASFYEDELGFVLGPAQVVLVTLSHVQSMPSTTEQDALMTIYERSEAHRLS